MSESTPHSLLRPRPLGLTRFVVISIVAHVAAVGFAMAYSAWISKPMVVLDQTPIKASLVRLGKPRDEKLLPPKEEEAAPPPPKVEPVKVDVAAAPTPPDTSVKIPVKEATPEQPIEAKKSDGKEAKKSLFDAFSKTGKAGRATEVEGQIDGDENGDSAKQEGERYYGLLKSVVQRNYDVSDSIPESERRTLKAEVALYIAENGTLQNVAMQKPSGNAVFDEAVLAAIRKAAPFTAPPEGLRGALKKQGVAIVFRATN
jgi:TonB family protein